MIPKFYTKEMIETDGYKQIEWEIKDNYPQPIQVWFKDSLMGRKLFAKCNGCKRFFDCGTVSKDSMYCEGVICPFCGDKHKFQLRK